VIQASIVGVVTAIVSSSSETTILRTAVGSPPAMGLVHRLKAEGVRVIGVDSSPLSAGLYLTDNAYVVPRGDDPRFLEEILRICDVENPRMIISGPEEEVLTLSKNKQSFKNVVLLCPDYETASVCANKIKTYEYLERLDIPIPRIYSPDKAVFPCIVKPAFGRGGRGVFKAETEHEIELFMKKVPNPIVQEYLNGQECSVDTLADLNGTPLSIVPRLRIEVESGVSMKGVTFYDKELINTCQRIVESFKLVGPACMQCIKQDDGYKFTEINTRFGGGSILSINADPSVVSNIIRMATGMTPLPSSGFTADLVMLTYYSTIFAGRHQLKRRGSCQ